MVSLISRVWPELSSDPQEWEDVLPKQKCSLSDPKITGDPPAHEAVTKYVIAQADKPEVVLKKKRKREIELRRTC